MDVRELLKRAEARRDEYARAITADATVAREFEFYLLTAPGPGREALSRSLQRSADFRNWLSMEHPIEAIGRVL